MKNKLTVAIALQFLTACSLVPDFHRPSVATPEHWQDAGLGVRTSAVDPNWWQTFGSVELNRLISQALSYNNDLAAAQQRVEQARAQAKIAEANLWPSVGVQGNFDDKLDNKTDRQTLGGQFTVAYEVDLWGANRARRDAGAARYLSSVFARDALKLVVMSNVAQTYFNYLALAERKRIAADFLDNTAKVLAIIEARFQAGAVSAVDVAQQQSELATARASLDLLIQQQRLMENALAVLLGLAPQPAESVRGHFLDLKLPEIKPQQPSELLERRPDVRQMEVQVLAATTDVGVARAALFPKLQLNLDSLLASPQPAGAALALAASLAQPVFQGGRLKAGVENARAVNAELMENYRKTVLTAFREVEDAAAVRSNSTRRLHALADAVDSARQAYELSLARYEHGAIDFQTLLTTQRTLLTAQNSQVQARQDVLIAMVLLYQALGGGWSSNEKR